MKKIFTLIAAAFVAVSVSAQTWSADAIAVADAEGASTPVDANTVLVDNDLAKVSTVFGTSAYKDSPDGIVFGSYSIHNYIQVRVDAWPTASAPTGTEKSGSTPLQVEAKKYGKLTLFYCRQAKDGAFASADGKDLVVYLNGSAVKADEFTKVADKGTDGAYAYCKTVVSIAEGNTYYVCAKGTTLKIMGFDVEASTPSEPSEPSESSAVIYENAAASVNADGFSTIEYTDGAKLILVGNNQKSYTSGNKMTLDGTEYKTTKVSNGAQNKFVAPEGKKVTKVQFYAYFNAKDEKADFEKYPETGFRPSYWREVNGVDYDITADNDVPDTNEIKSRTDLVESSFDLPGVSAFTFNNTGEQLCFVMKITYGTSTGITNVANEIPTVDATYNVAGQRVNANTKGLVIKNGKKYINR